MAGKHGDDIKQFTSIYFCLLFLSIKHENIKGITKTLNFYRHCIFKHQNSQQTLSLIKLTYLTFYLYNSIKFSIQILTIIQISHWSKFFIYFFRIGITDIYIYLYKFFQFSSIHYNTNLCEPLSLSDELLLLLFDPLDLDLDLSIDFECFFFLLLRLLLVCEAGDEAGIDAVADFGFSNPSLLEESENCLEVPGVHLAPRLQKETFKYGKKIKTLKFPVQKPY
jgi:hypothetical protein